MSERRPTIHQVAKLAKVSPATVSRVINGNVAVDETLAKRVRKVVADLDYRPSAVARSLRSQRTSTIAVIVPDIANPFFTSVIAGLEDEAQASDTMVVICSTDNDPQRENAYLQLAIDRRMDGVILASDANDLPQFSRNGRPLLPTVLIDREVPSLEADSVLVDNARGSQLAVDHLLSRGAQRIACITGPESVSTAVQRLAGFRAAVGKRYRSELVRHADYRVEGGRAATADLLDRAETRNGDFDAILVCNNLMTMGALQVLAECRKSVPGKMLLVGFDDEPWSAYWRPSLTTVAQPARDVGRTAMQILAERINAPDAPTRAIQLRPELIVRESTHPRSAKITPSSGRGGRSSGAAARAGRSG